MKIVSGSAAKGDLRVRHDSFDTYLEYVQSAKRHSDSGDHSSSISAKPSWDLDAGWEGALRMSRYGWPEGLEALNKARALVDVPEHSDQGMHMKPFSSVSGEEVDIGLYMTGEPECMTDYQLQLTPSYGKVAKVIVNSSASCSVNAKTMRHRGTSALILIDALESAGIRCEVVLLAFACHELISEVLIKRADDHVEPDRMAFMLAHPAVMRRFGFKEMETHGGETGRQTRGGYGCPADLPVEEREQDGTIYFDRHYSGYHSERGMIDKTNELLRKYVSEELALNE